MPAVVSILAAFIIVLAAVAYSALQDDKQNLAVKQADGAIGPQRPVNWSKATFWLLFVVLVVVPVLATLIVISRIN